VLAAGGADAGAVVEARAAVGARPAPAAADVRDGPGDGRDHVMGGVESRRRPGPAPAIVGRRPHRPGRALRVVLCREVPRAGEIDVHLSALADRRIRSATVALAGGGRGSSGADDARAATAGR